MCQSDVLQAIQTAVQDKVNKGDLFTAFDITRSVKSANPQLQFRHNDVKHDIHDAICSLAPNYLRTLITLPNIPVQPFLYYPQGADPATYQTGNMATTVAQNQQAASQNPAPTYNPVPPTSNNGDPDVINPDTRGRLWVPVRFITSLGVACHQQVFVTKTTHKTTGGDVPALRITTAAPAGSTETVEYLVDRHANIAISRGVLIDAGIDGNADYKVEGSANEIIVRVA